MSNEKKNYGETLNLPKTDYIEPRTEMVIVEEKKLTAIESIIQKIKDILCENGADISMMSGSGPSVFGIFSSKEQASAAKDALVGMGAIAHLCEPV